MRHPFAWIVVLVTALVALILPGVAPAVGPTAASVFTVPAAIDSTGRTDVSAAMAAFLRTVPNGAFVELRPHARYRMERTLSIAGRHHLTLDGNGAMFFATTPGDARRTSVRISSSAHIAIRDLVVRGANPHGGTSREAYEPAREHQHGFEILSTSDVALVDVTVTDVYGDFVYLGRTGHGAWTNQMLVRGSHFARNGRQGVSPIAARNVLIERTGINQVRRATFDFEPMGAKAGVDHVTIRDNYVGSGRLLFVAANGVRPVNHVIITGNRLRGQALQICVENPRWGNRNHWKIAGNSSDTVFGNPHGSVMRVTRVDGIQIRNNGQRFQAGRNMVMVHVTQSCHVDVGANSHPRWVGEARVTGHC